MKRVFVRRPSPAMIVATIALFVALGGTSYAAFTVPKDSVGTAQLQKHAVTESKIQNGSVSNSKIKHGAVTAGKINTAGLTVPNALQANNATTAGTAANATNATDLGGIAASGYQRHAMWVLAAADGTVLAQSGGITVDNTATGIYNVGFPASAAGSPISALLNNAVGMIGAAPCGGSASPGGINCLIDNDTDHVAVLTADNTGTDRNKAFYLVVNAP